MKYQGLKKGSFILLTATAVSKLLGIAFKIPLTNILGGSGMGYFASAYGIFIPIYTVVCAGLPTALIRLVARNCADGKYKTARKLKQVASRIFLVTGLLGTVFILAFAKPMSLHIAKNPDCFYSILTLAPSLVFCCLAAINRGYYEGMRNMYPTAVSQVCESIAKTVLGLALAVGAIKFGMNSFYETGTVFGRTVATVSEAKNACLPFGAAGAMLGSTFSEIAGLVAIYMKTKLFGDGISEEEYENSPESESAGTLAKQLFSISLPLILGAVVSGASSFLELLTVMSSLNRAVQNGLANFLCLADKMPLGEIPNFLYGSYNGLTGTVISFVPIVAGLLSRTALPEVSADCNLVGGYRLRRSIESIIEATLIFSVPAGFCICALSKQILTILYPLRTDEISVSALPLSILGISAVFMSIIIPVSTMLCAIGKEKMIFFLNLGSMALRLTLNILLVRIPQINISGVAISSAVTNIITASVAVVMLIKGVKAELHFKRIFAFTFAFSAVSAVLITVAQRIAFNYFGELKSVILSLSLGVICYFFLLFYSKVLKKADFKALFMKKHLK